MDCCLGHDMQIKRVIYTVNFGMYDSPKPPPGTPLWDKVAIIGGKYTQGFVDEYKSLGWSVVTCNDEQNDEEGSTWWKILGPIKCGWDESIYIDASSSLNFNADWVWSRFDGDIGLERWHSWSGAEAELGRSVLVGAVPLDLAKKQLMEATHWGITNITPVYKGAMVLRRLTDVCVSLCEKWWEMYERFPYRDQPPLMIALAMVKPNITELPFDSFSTWKHSHKRDSSDKYRKMGADYHWREYQNGGVYKDKVDRCCELIGQRGTVLDFGCGDGVSCSLLGDLYNNNVVGVEIDQSAAKVAQERTTARVCSYVQDEEYDAILCMDSLEHVIPDYVYQDIWKRIRECPKVVVSLPKETSVDPWACRVIPDAIMEYEGFSKDREYPDEQIWVKC